MINYKPLRYSLTALFSLGAIVLVGILSFSGMLYLTNNIALSLASSVLAVLIEGEIYKQNIFGGIGMLLHLGTFIKRNNYCKKLKKLAENEKLRSNCPLLDDYYQLLQYKEALLHANFLDRIKYRADLEQTEKSLAEMEDIFIRYLQNDIDPNDHSAMKLVSSLFYTDYQKYLMQQELEKTIKKEKLWLWISMPITVVGGALAVLVTASQLSAAFITFGIVLTPVLMATVVWPIAIVAAIGFTIMIYKTFVDVVHNKVLQKNWKAFKKLFSKEQSTINKVLYVVGIVLLTALAFVATIATAGTWWSAAKTGLSLIPFITTFSNTIKTVIVSIGMSLLGIALFVFDYVNNLESFKILTSTLSRAHVPTDQLDAVEKMPQIKKLFTIIGYNLQHAFIEWTKKPWGVMFNPFTWLNKIIALPFRAVLFVGHCVSIGVTSDRLGDLNAAIPATICSLQEATTDLPYVDKRDDLHDKAHQHAHHHDHNHSDLAGYFLNVALFPTKLGSALWNTAFGDKSFKSYFYEELGINKSVSIETPEFSVQWQSYKKLLSPKIESLEENTDTQTDSLEEESNNSNKDSVPLAESDELAKLSHHRNSFFMHKDAKSLQPDIGLMESSRSLACG